MWPYSLSFCYLIFKVHQNLGGGAKGQTHKSTYLPESGICLNDHILGVGRGQQGLPLLYNNGM